jgi:type I restriction enzyme M protein
MLGKIATAGQNGQFRTPRHIIQLMVEMTAPTPTTRSVDPACGTAGFLVAASEHLRDHPPDGDADAKPSGSTSTTRCSTATTSTTPCCASAA